MNEFIRLLKELTKNDIKCAGGKAVNLAHLSAAGFNVAPAFCITTNAYEAFLEHTGLQEKINEILTRIDFTHIQDIQKCGAALRSLVMEQHIPDEVTEAIANAYHTFIKELGTTMPVVVRSSASMEDMPELSFAGQHETYLNIIGEMELLFHVKKCWTSLWTDRALSYRYRNNILHQKIFMGVVVQKMISSSVSGILFTKNPVTNDAGEILINACWGLGEAAVSGHVLPDEYIIDKDKLTITHKSIAEKERMVVPAETATTEADVPDDRKSQQCLTDTKILQLAALGKQIEAYFGIPQDIEWGFRDYQFFFLQARPITAVKEKARMIPVVWGHPITETLVKDMVVFWSNWNTREIFPHPLTPLSWSYFIESQAPGMFEKLWGISPKSSLYPYTYIVDQVYGRLYWNMNLLWGHPLWGSRISLLKRLLSHLDKEAGQIFNQMIEEGELKPVKVPVSFFTVVWVTFIALLTAISSSVQTLFLSKNKLQKMAAHYWEEATVFENMAMEGKSVTELLKEIKDFTARSINIWAPLLVVSFFYLINYKVIKFLARKWTDLSLDKLSAGIPGNKTTEGALELYTLSQMPDSLKQLFLTHPVEEITQLLSSNEEGKKYLQKLEHFMSLYGHRGVKEFDIAHPRWKEKPEFVYQMIKNYLQLSPEDINPLEHFKKAANERQQLTRLIQQRLSSGFLSRIFPVRRWLFNRMLNMTHKYLPYRENPKYYVLKCFSGTRRIFSEIGRRFCVKGYLAAPEDIYYLSMKEMESPDSTNAPDIYAIQDLILKRKQEHELYMTIEPPFIVRSDGKIVPYQVLQVQQSRILKGAAASPGKVMGIARVILDPEKGSSFNKGEILVARTTDPGWTPLFLTASALVMEAGGIISHAAIVAREYGIPAIVGVKDATRFIATGDRIMVNADEGIVILLP